MKAIRVLIVEDNALLLSELKKHYRGFFESQGFDSVVIEQAGSASEAKQLAKGASSNPYDLVSLDVNLGDAEVTGLDVLSAFKRFQSAWMVALLTGVEEDGTLDATVGKSAATKLRKQLRRDAYARFPAERLMVVEKPSSSLPTDEAAKLLRNRIQQIALVYIEVGRLRYIFRRIEVTSLERVVVPKQDKAKILKRKFVEAVSLHWQIRFNCGDIRTLPNKAGFKTLHHLLSLEPGESLTPEVAMVIEPRNEKASQVDSALLKDDQIAEHFKGLGIDLKALTPQRQDEVKRATLSLDFERYRELRGFEDDDDLSFEESEELTRIKRKFGVLEDMAETFYQRMRPKDGNNFSEEISTSTLVQNDLHIAGGSYEHREDGRGEDSPEAARFRARKKRVCDCLRENGFADFANHVESYVMSTGANWSYIPPSEIEWTT
jgi:DNA-binding NarL/FixJ family response regulator